MTDVGTTETTDTTHPLRLGACPRCGYSLAGLPLEGVCPECGRGYDQQTVVLHGWARGSKANVGNADPWTAPVMALLPVLYAGNAVWRWWRTGSAWRLGVAAAWLAVMAWMLWRRFNRTGPGPTQVRLSSRGLVQVDEPVEEEPAELTPWDKVTEVVLKPTLSENYRLSLVHRPAWWSWVMAYVDAEVQCTPAQAEAVRRRIDGWRNPAHSPADPAAATATSADPDLESNPASR